MCFRRFAALWVVPAIGVAMAVTGCQPPSVAPSWAKDLPVAEDLSAKPLYQFNEAEVDRYLRGLRKTEPDLPRRVVHLGRKNIGQPYEIYLLGEFPFEYYDPQPIYCLNKSDCVVFSEHTYAMALASDWWSFLRNLQRIRYRDGRIGMLSRNHYTVADWDRNNGFLFEDMTRKLGGGQVWVPLNQIVRRAQFFAKHGIGQDIPDETVTDAYIPKDQVPRILGELRNADFVNIIRGNEKQQDAGHTGLIAIGADGTADFLHSARPAVREQPLIEYVQSDRGCLGIKILRLRPDAERIMADAVAASPLPAQISDASLKAAVAANPLTSDGPSDPATQDWIAAMKLQSYRLEYDTPVDSGLQAELARIDREVAGRLGIPDQDRAVGVLDLTDLRLALVRPDEMFYGASVPKICILLGYFETHPEAASDLTPDVQGELELMIKRSSNELAAKYSQIVGLDRLQKILESPRYRFYDRKHGGGLWCGKHYGLDQPRIGDPLKDHSHAATVRQCLRYYLMLEQGGLVSAEACLRMKAIFAAPQLEFHNESFVAGLNRRDVTILRKGGLWEDWHLDTARIHHGDRVYLLAGMAKHADGQKYLAGVAGAIDEALCGSRPPKPYTHRLVLHDTPDAFRRGTFGQAAVSTDPAGVVMAVGTGPGAAGSGGGAIYQSPEIESETQFNEAVVSWNVDAPAGTGFCVEVRVGRRFNDSWSPYLWVGEWGDVLPAGDRTLKCDEGYVDVDYFRSDRWFDRVQYRIRAVGGQDERHVRIARVGLCLSDTTGIPTALSVPEPTRPPVERREWQRRLPVPYQSQKTEVPELRGQNCSPTSLSMVMAYRGAKRSHDEVARRIYDPTNRIYGNWPRAIQTAWTYGVPGYLARFSDWGDVERLIADGQPLIISIVAEKGELNGAPYSSTPGHIIVLTGFDGRDGVTVNDPDAPDAKRGQLVYPRKDLEKVWMERKGGTAYVLLPVLDPKTANARGVPDAGSRK